MLTASVGNPPNIHLLMNQKYISRLVIVCQEGGTILIKTRLPSTTRVIKQYKILAEFDGGDGRHYIPGEVVSLEKWRPEHIQDLFTRRFAVEVEQPLEQPSEAPSDEGEEVETWPELQPEM